MTQFSQLGLAEPILRAVAAEGYETPTPIQAGVIPAMRDGRDVVGVAQTGTGKTAAFVLPLLHALSQMRGRPQPKTARVLVLAPTRELAAQIANNAKAYGRHLRLSHAVVVGGVKHGPQIRALSRGVDLLIATPGRLEDHLREHNLRLDALTAIVLDEADQMLDLGFFPAIRRIMNQTPNPRQTILLSATMPPPIRALADEFLSDAVEIAVAPQSTPIERITQSVIPAQGAEKRAKLIETLRGAEVESAIVFTRTKRGADRVADHLEAAGLAAGAIHGNKSQSQRVRTLDAFREGRLHILVATDIAARGIDVDGVSHVVNFELPNVPESYVHRIGRTARAGASGVAVSLVDGEEVKLLRAIEKLIGFRIDGGETLGGGRDGGPKRARPNAPRRRNAPRRGPARRQAA